MFAAIRRIVARLRAMFRRDELDRDFAREIESHVEMLTEENVRRGVSVEEARRQARLRVGNGSSLGEQHGDARGFRFLEDLGADLRFAWRLILKERGFSAAVIAVVALGIGANAMGFTIVNAAFLRGFAFERADQLHILSWRRENGRRSQASCRDLEDWRARSASFSGMAAWSLDAVNVSDDAAFPEQTLGAWVTSNAFDVLRQKPVLGRAFLPGEDARTAPRVAILGYEIWSNRFGRDPKVLGRTIRLNGEPATIVGVMAQGMKFPENAEIWAPFVPTDAQLAREARSISVFGRLKDGVSAETAAAELDGIARQIAASEKDATKGLVGTLVETFIGRFLGGAARPMFVTVMGAVVFVLLIACANVANLLLSRGLARSHEVAVRYSLGASRGRIVRQLLIESVVLSGIGGLIGLGFATFGIRAFDAAVQASQPPYWLRFMLDARVLLYVAAICVATGVVFGLAPALRISRNGASGSLKESARGSTMQRRDGRFSMALVVLELALTVVLLCGAGLMGRSFLALYAVDPGFDVEGLSRMRMQLPQSKYPTSEARLAFYDALQPRIEAIPGISKAAFATSAPPIADDDWRIEIEGRTFDDDHQPTASMVAATAGYFDALGVSFFAGRVFGEADHGNPGADPIVINQVMARRYFEGSNPLGQRIRFLPRGRDAAPSPWRTIIGVSGPLLQGESFEAFRSPVVYQSLSGTSPRTVSLIVRSSLPPASVMNAVRREVQRIDVDQPVFAIQTLAQTFEEERIVYRIFATLFSVLAAIALVLSATGVHGVMAYAVTQRRHEIGVRLAIGAKPAEVAWVFLRRGLWQLTAGLVVGIPAALALAQVVRFRLVEIEPTDPAVFLGITAILAATAIAASFFPARRASRVDPMVVLRTE